MILADTSIWIDYFRSGESDLRSLLDAEQILMHPFVLGEIACGLIRDRALNLEFMRDLPQSQMVTHDEVLYFIEHNRVAGRGIGYVDVHLLAAVAVTSGSSIWTFDKRLHTMASELELAYKRD